MSEQKTNNDSTETTPFSQAVANFSEKVNKFKTTKKTQSKLPRVHKQEQRTTSLSHVQITLVSEDSSQVEEIKPAVGLRRNSSNLSLMSMSSVGGSSSMSKGSFFPLGTSKIDKIRYYNKNKHQILSSNTYKQKRTKLNLERDIKWNGPYDEEFFKCFEQLLDRAIKKLVAKDRAEPSTLSTLSSNCKDSRTPVHFKRPQSELEFS